MIGDENDDPDEQLNAIISGTFEKPTDFSLPSAHIERPTEQSDQDVASDLEFGEEPKTKPKRKKTGSRKRPCQRDTLLSALGSIDLWHDPSRVAYATLPINDHFENWPVRSRDMKLFIANIAFKQMGLAPGGQALEDTIRVLDARAINEGPMRQTWLRTGANNGRLYVDLGDPAWSVVTIGPGGWEVISGKGLPFVRSPRMRPLPVPVAGELIELFYGFCNVADKNDLVLIVAWIIAALRDRGPYPILILNGEQGSGKSSFSRRLRSLVDRSSPAIQGPPKDEQNLIVTAQNAHLLVFDNLSHIDAELSDSLCRLATGAGFAVRALHTDHEENAFEGARPIIVNGIPAIGERPDFSERSITVRLMAIPEDQRRPEDELDAEWEAAHPRIFGAICDALSSAVKNIENTHLTRCGRMADFEKWVTAAEPGLGWEPGTFSKAYSENRRDTEDATFEADIVAIAIRDFIMSCSGPFEGSATQLLSALDSMQDEKTKQLRSWPKSNQALGNSILRSIPLLRRQGIIVEKHHSGDRRIIITRAEGAQP